MEKAYISCVFCVTTLLRMGKPCLHMIQLINFKSYTYFVRDFGTSVGKLVATYRNHRVRVFDTITINFKRLRKFEVMLYM